MTRRSWICFALLLAGCAPRNAGVEWLVSVRHAQGDSAHWGRPEFDDSHWSESAFWQVPHPAQVLWIRSPVQIPQDRGPFAVSVAALASYELWWDGVRIGGGGRVGSTPEAEIPGPVEMLHAIPDSLSRPGAHVLALRTSAFHQHFTPASDFHRLGIGRLEAVVIDRREGAWIALTSLSGILLGTLLAFVMFWLNPRDRSSLILGFLGLAAAVLLGAESWRPLVGYTYDGHIARLITICALTWTVGMLLGAFVLTRFPRRRGRWALVLLVAAISLPLVVAPSWNDKPVGMDLVAFTFAGFWTSLAVRARHRGALPALAGVLIALAFLAHDPRSFLDRNYFLAIDILLACLLVGHLLEWRDELARRQEAVARSARLEAEVLKRQLQPHFVMNTLTAIGGWIEEDPATAMRMIEALADELRMLTRIADRRLIPLRDELLLCRSHLRTLELRRETRYRLETRGVDEADPVPPALVHTLVENAVTHGPRGAREVTLRLEADHRNGRTHYTFTSPRGERAGEKPGPGTGTRYMMARLREAWGDNWSLTQEAVGDLWRVSIDVPGASV